jgi:hypothetical protein
MELRRPKGIVSDDRERGIIGSVRSVQHAAKVLEQALHDLGLPATVQPCLPCQRRLHPTSALILQALGNLSAPGVIQGRRHQTLPQGEYLS